MGKRVCAMQSRRRRKENRKNGRGGAALMNWVEKSGRIVYLDVLKFSR